jgi:hypothetical protein
LESVNVICMKWGTRYGAHYVNRLFHGVKNNLNRPFRFVCFTDDDTGLEEGIESFPLPPITIPEQHTVSPWRKLSLFSKELADLSGKTLFLDLDVIIVDTLDDFFDFSENFSIIENWTQKGRGIGNSSVYCFNIGQHADILEYYESNQDEVFANYSNEQIYLSLNIKDKQYWPETWCKSFKFHAIPRGIKRLFVEPSIPSGCKIVVFHGYPNPDQAMIGDYGKKLRKYFKPATWIEKYWV